jgi:hypothetical protein
MQGIMRYSGCLLVGIAIGYGLAQWQQPVLLMSDAEHQVSVPVPTAVSPDNVAPSTEAIAAAPQPPVETKHQPTVESPAVSEPARQQSTLDENWLAIVEQQYPKRLQQDLSAFPDPVKQQMQAFQQTEVDADWAQATEQQVQDLLITQPELKFLQVERVQCRQNACEMYGTSLNPAALDALDRQLRRFHSNNTNMMIMDLTKPGSELGNFYLLLSGMKKD